MVGVSRPFEDAAGLFGRIWVLALVNLVLSLLDIGNMEKVLYAGEHAMVSFTFSMPTVIPTLWSLLNIGNVGVVSVGSQAPTLTMNDVLVSLVYILVVSPIEFIYIHFMLNHLKGPGFRASGMRILDILAYNTILLILMVFAEISFQVNTALGVFMIIAFIVIYYFIYATPYISVLLNMNLAPALGAAARAAAKGGYLAYTIIYGLITLVISPILSAMTYEGGLVGITVASFIEAPIGVWLSASTLIMTMRYAGG